MEDPAPNTREHWALESKYSPASLVTLEPASSRLFLGLFLRHDPNPALNTIRYNYLDGREQRRTHSIKCVTCLRLHRDHSQGFELWSRVLDMTKVV